MSKDTDMGAALVPGYAGHADARARRLSDQQVRAWVGEMLAELRGRLPADGPADRLDALMMRCEFSDPHVIHAVEDERFGQPELVELVEACDRRLIEAARNGRTADAADLGALLDGLERAFDERAAAIAERLKR
jgi:hypothetical protein